MLMQASKKKQAQQWIGYIAELLFQLAAVPPLVNKITSVQLKNWSDSTREN